MFKSLGAEAQKESPINGPIVPKFKPVDRRKLSLDMDYKERVRNQDLMKILKGKVRTWLQRRDLTGRQVALGIKTQPKRMQALKTPGNFSKKEFISPKTHFPGEMSRPTEIFRNVSPLMMPMPRIDVNMVDTSGDDN